MIFKYDFEIGLENINDKLEVTNKALLQFLENCAAKHSDSIQRGIANIIDNGVTWVLLEWNLKVIERPKYGEILEIHTWIRDCTKFYTYRDFEIYSNGKLKVIASAKWMLIDINKLKPVRISEDLLKEYEPEIGKSAFNEIEFPKMLEQENYEREINFHIRRSDIDVNNHVHNLNYLDMVHEVFDIDETDNVRILFKKEIKYKDKVNVLGIKRDKKYYIKIYNKNDNSEKALIELY